MKFFAILFSFLMVATTIASDGHLKVIKGKVKIGDQIHNKGKIKVKHGNTVSVAPKSMAIVRFTNGALLKLKEKTSIVIERPKTTKKKTTNSYLLRYGSIIVKAVKSKRRDYNVKVPKKNAILGVRGTQFFVSYSNEKKEMWSCVNEGVVDFYFEKDPSKKISIKAGEGVKVISDVLPDVKKYPWTKKLNWKMSGVFSELDDKIDIENINYDLQNFIYE